MTPQSWFILAGFAGLAVIFAVVLVAARRGANALSERVFVLLGVISEKNDEIAKCLAANKAVHARNERLHNDLKAMRGRLPRLADEPTPAMREYIADMERRVARAQLTPLATDEPVTRPYIKPVREVEG